jgi:hypothetical protein
VKGYGSERIEDQEDDRHHTGVSIPFAIEDLEGVAIHKLIRVCVLYLLRQKEGRYWVGQPRLRSLTFSLQKNKAVTRTNRGSCRAMIRCILVEDKFSKHAFVRELGDMGYVQEESGFLAKNILIKCANVIQILMARIWNFWWNKPAC